MIHNGELCGVQWAVAEPCELKLSCTEAGVMKEARMVDGGLKIVVSYEFQEY